MSRPTLAPTPRWRLLHGITLNDGCEGCTYFDVERMAVPFDGVGTLVLINSGNDNSVYWQSATGRFQKPTTGLGTRNMWVPYQPGAAGTGATFSAPWSGRAQAATATDAEGLLLVMTGGYGSSFYGDAWQLSWQSAANQLVYQLTSAAGFEQRALHAMYAVHDWLFVYGGYQDSVPHNLDDAWMSGDYGSTWTRFVQYATVSSGGQTTLGRNTVNGVTVGRRLFIIAGYAAGSYANDVWVGYW